MALLDKRNQCICVVRCHIWEWLRFLVVFLSIVASLCYAFLTYPKYKAENTHRLLSDGIMASKNTHCLLSGGIMALWTLIPPIYFWCDWRFSKEKSDYKKNLHDLGRNVWLALLAVLAYAFGIKPLGGP